MLRSLIIAVLLAAPTLAFAQGKAPNIDPETQATRMTDRMTEHLGLDADQQAAALEIHRAFAAETHRVRQDQTLSGEEKTAAIQQASQTRKSALEEILSPTQMEKMPARSAEGIGRQGRKPGSERSFQQREQRGPEDAEARLQRMQEELSLSEEQVIAIRQWNDEHKVAAQRAASTKRDEHETALREILTEEQFAQWESKRQSQGSRQHKRAGHAPAQETR